MNTPILDCLRDYIIKKPARFHLPGHKGKMLPPFDQIAPFDVTELPQTGDLYREDDTGVIRHSEQLTARIYGFKDAFYLTGGATQGIFAMLAAVTRPGDEIVLDRAAHLSVFNAMALLDLRPRYLFRETLLPWGIGGKYAAPFPSARGASAFVYTSPDYYGLFPFPPSAYDNLPHLADSAHGAHLPFRHCQTSCGLCNVLDNEIPVPPVPYCSVSKTHWNLAVVSAHKTLGALGQSAILLSDGSIPPPVLRNATALTGTASPSFVLLASIEAALRDAEQWDSSRIIDFVRDLRDSDDRFLTYETGHHWIDPHRITMYTGDGHGDARTLAAQGIIPEFADEHNLIFLLSPHNTPEELQKLKTALQAVPRRRFPPVSPPVSPPKIAATPREAMFGEKRTVTPLQSLGKIAAAPVVPFPPGIPLVAPGEVFSTRHVQLLKQKNIQSVTILK